MAVLGLEAIPTEVSSRSPYVRPSLSFPGDPVIPLVEVHSLRMDLTSLDPWDRSPVVVYNF